MAAGSSADPAAIRRVLSRADPALLAAEIHLTSERVCALLSPVPDGRPTRVSGSSTHACVRVWASGGRAQMCVEDAGHDAMAWALTHAARTARAGAGTGARTGAQTDARTGARTAAVGPDDIPRPTDRPEPPEIDGPDREIDDDALADSLVELAAVAAGRRLPVRDVRLSAARQMIATVSTTGIAAVERRTGIVAGAYVAFRHPLEPADALTAVYHPADTGAAIALLVGELEADRTAVAEVRGDPVPAVPAGIPVLCRPRATARLLALVARRLTGRRSPTGHGQAWSRALRLEENPHEPTNPLRRRFDDEGLPTGRLALVRDGRQVAHPHTTATAAAAGCRPNGCAVRGTSHAPLPGYRGLDPAPTGALPDLDEVLLVDDLIVSQEAARGNGPVIALGRLRRHGTHRAVRWTTAGLVDRLITEADVVAPDGRWYLDGVRGRSVLIGAGR